MKWLALLLLAACAGRTGEILRDTGDLSEATGSPRIGGVLELGGGDVLLTAPLAAAAGDGIATVGEALWIRGSQFGRQPTVTIAGRPAAVLARTVDGGLVVRVPPGVPVGAQTLTVANQEGQGDQPLVVRRVLAIVPPEGGKLAMAELGADGPRAAGELPVAGQQVRMSGDGRAAYVFDGATTRLTVVELPAQRGPRQAMTLELGGAAARGGGGEGDGAAGRAANKGGGPVVAFATAAVAPVLMIFRAREVLLLDTTSPLRPLRSEARALPMAIQKGGPIMAALSPDGQTAAVVLEDGNRLVLLNVGGRGPVTALAEMSLAPEARVPVVVDVAFVADGRTVWVALGDTMKSHAVGPQPTELVAVRIGRAANNEHGGAGAPVTSPKGTATGAAGTGMVVARRVRLPEAQAPVLLNTGRAPPLSSGASIRLPPERAAVYLTAHNRAGGLAVFRLGAEDHATVFSDVAGVGGLAGAGELSPDGRWLLVPVVQSAGGELGGRAGRLTLVAVPADDHPGQRRVVDLGAVAQRSDGTSLGAPGVPSVSCQP